MAETYSLIACKSCGKKIPDYALACLHCGASFVIPKTMAAVPTPKAKTPPIEAEYWTMDACPQCGSGYIERVAVLVAGGTVQDGFTTVKNDLAASLGIRHQYRPPFYPRHQANALFFEAFLVCTGVGLPVAIYLWYWAKSKDDAEREIYNRRAEDDLDQLKAKRAIWNNLYYCDKCDLVLCPKSGRARLRSRMAELL